MDGLNRAERELLKQLPVFASTRYEAAEALVDKGLAVWGTGIRFGCGPLLPSGEPTAGMAPR